MKQSAILLQLFAFAFCVISPALGGKHSVYREEFDRYGDYVASFNQGAKIVEWPSSLKMLDFQPQGLSEARKGFFKIGTPPVSDTYAVFFRFQMNSPENRTFRLRLYYPDEEAGATLSVTPSPYANGPFHVVATVRDADGRVCEEIAFDVAEPVERKVAFKEKEFGYYSVSYAVLGSDGKAFITHPASFVLLPPDTRQAGYESPYYIWNFCGAHGTPRELDDWGDMLLRLGVRRTLLPDNLGETHPAVMKYKLTHGEFGNGRIDYPITVTGLGIGTYPRVLNILEMEETGRSILLKDVTVY